MTGEHPCKNPCPGRRIGRSAPLVGGTDDNRALEIRSRVLQDQRVRDGSFGLKPHEEFFEKRAVVGKEDVFEDRLLSLKMRTGRRAEQPCAAPLWAQWPGGERVKAGGPGATALEHILRMQADDAGQQRQLAGSD